MCGFAYGLAPFPAIEVFGCAIPVSNDIVHVVDEHHIVSEFKKSGLSALCFAKIRLASWVALRCFDSGSRNVADP